MTIFTTSACLLLDRKELVWIDAKLLMLGNKALHYITLHYITLHYITLHYITLHYITLPLKMKNPPELIQSLDLHQMQTSEHS